MTNEPYADAAGNEDADGEGAPKAEASANGSLEKAAESGPPSQDDVGQGAASEIPPLVCAGCNSSRGVEETFCPECGYLFPDAASAIATTPPLPQAGEIVGGRYQIGELIGQRGPVLRFRGCDLGPNQTSRIPIVIVRQEFTPLPESSARRPKTSDSDLFDLPLSETRDESSNSATAITVVEFAPTWPSLAWERLLLARLNHLSLPRVLDTLPHEGFEYLIIEVPEGRSFWDVWDETADSWHRRCEWLIQIAEALNHLHECGAMLEGIRPDIITISATGQAVITDLTDLLPLPVPSNLAVRGSLYSAPELVLAGERADARADLYSFGAMVYALMLGRELTDLDFALQGVPKPYLERFPDGHPLLGRLLGRTFSRDPSNRLPSRDFANDDPTGFQELIEILRACQRSLGMIHLEVSAWTNTGMVRSANEDAVAALHSLESRLEDNDDFALLLLADGMGGMACGEVAAAMTVESIRDYFLKHPPFTELLLDPSRPLPLPAVEKSLDAEKYRDAIREALQEANRAVFEASRTNMGHMGMGCTAQVVIVDGRHVEVGHVGDSRTYHLRHGFLRQVTQDQTLVSHLVALGQMTEEEAEAHPQRSELQQAIGGRREIYPDTYCLTIEPGDWLLVCSDGLSNQLRNSVIAETMRVAGSAEKAARRLVNQAILAGALDNVSVIVVRVC